MPDLKVNELSDAREQPAPRHGQPQPPRGLGGLAAAAAATARRAAAAAGPRQLWRRHRLITILVIVSFLPRILASLAFRPALLTADSFLYMQEAANGTLGVIRPSGYSWFLDYFPDLPAHPAGGDHGPAPPGHRHRRRCLRAAAVLGPARLGRLAGRAADPVRHPRDRAGVVRPAGHAVRVRAARGRGTAADQAHPAAVAVRRGRAAASPTSRCCAATASRWPSSSPRSS